MKYLKIAAIVALPLLAGTSEAQVSRVFVSTSGNDGNDCLQPATACRTLSGGIAKVDAHGEVIITETGSYAGGTITKSVKIDAPLGVVAFTATPLMLNPGPTGIIVVRGLTLKALIPGGGGGTGVWVLQGTLFLENSVIDGWDLGVEIAANSKAFVKNTVFRNNSGGLKTIGNPIAVSIEGSFFENNSIGVMATGGHVAVSRSVASGNDAGFQASGAGTVLTIQFCQASHNGSGVRTISNGLARVSDSTIAGNVFGLDNVGGTLERFGTNLLSGNGSNLWGTIAVGALQ